MLIDCFLGTARGSEGGSVAPIMVPAEVKLGSGEHEVRIGDGAWYPPGVYMARLTQGGHTARAHVALIH